MHPGFDSFSSRLAVFDRYPAAMAVSPPDIQIGKRAMAME
jgi:hypothetical protein